jgi:single-strand DNA-binding protein
MASFNVITIVGNLGRDPELRYTPQGKAVADFTVATNEKRNGEEIVTWFKCTLWGNTAEAAAKYLTKGSQAYITGRLSVEEWTDKDGNNRHTLSVNASDVQFLGTREQASEQPRQAAAVATASGGYNDDDSIPF